MNEVEEYPVNEAVTILDHHTLRKGVKYWTAFLIIRYGRYKNAKPILAFYRWVKRKDKDTNEESWKLEKKWTINSIDDWFKIQNLVNEKLLKSWTSFSNMEKEKPGQY